MTQDQIKKRLFKLLNKLVTLFNKKVKPDLSHYNISDALEDLEMGVGYLLFELEAIEREKQALQKLLNDRT